VRGRTDAPGATPESSTGAAAPSGIPSTATTADAAPTGAVPPSGLRLPSRPVSALLVLVFLGFGVLLGNVAGSNVDDTLASTRSPVKIVSPPSATASTSTSASTPSESSASNTSSEPPAAESEPTPSATKSTSAKTPASSSAGSSGSTSSEGSSSGSPKDGSSKTGSGESASKPAKKLPPVKHVFVIMLSGQPYASVFGPASTAPYLSGTLEHKGELLSRYDAVAHDALADEVALLSGQGATAETAVNCPKYTELATTGAGEDEQVLGSGCVYPTSTQTLLGQLSAKHLTWKAYVQGIDEGAGQPGACAHPTLGQADPTAEESASTGAYATFRNPFVYFASVVDSSQCAADDVGLASLKGDLAAAKSTPSFSYIVPDRCHDGNPTPCTAGAAAGMVPAEAFLKQVVPEITASSAYKQNGLLVITVDQAPGTGAFADSSACCGQPLFPNAPSKSLAGTPRGGGAVGALLLSPYVKGGTTSQEQYNHFSLLRTIEDLFGLKHLGYAGLSAVKSFEPAMFTAGKS
jgi:phosphatidylinositol-3-phosphatase